VPAITAALGFQERTVRGWWRAAGDHTQAIHAALVQQPRALEHVQAAAIRVKAQGRICWLALALQVSTRLWWGGAVSATRDRALIDRVAAHIRAWALIGVLLVAGDGWSSYVGALQRALRERVPPGGRGAPRTVLGAGLVIGQVVKRTAPRRVVEVEHWIAQGTATAARELLKRTGSAVLNTAYRERLNGTCRERWAPLARRTRHLLGKQTTLEAGMYLVGTGYNVCTPHESLVKAGQRWTPAMAAGMTEHCWTVGELLWYKVPPARWTPPTQRGRRSAAMQRLIERWAA